jgi:hypothetical protein
MSDTELRYLKPEAVRFFKAGALLRVTLEGECSLLQAAVVRMFPLSRTDRYFSVRDGGGKEAGVLASLDGLDDLSLACVREELERRYMVFRLTAVRKARERFGIVEWDVETNRGPCRFSTRELRDNVIRLPEHHYLLTDVEGNRFEIANLLALDANSQVCLLRYL